MGLSVGVRSGPVLAAVNGTAGEDERGLDLVASSANSSYRAAQCTDPVAMRDVQLL
jgi:hypothetical protein